MNNGREINKISLRFLFQQTWTLVGTAGASVTTRLQALLFPLASASQRVISVYVIAAPYCVGVGEKKEGTAGAGAVGVHKAKRQKQGGVHKAKRRKQRGVDRDART